MDKPRTRPTEDNPNVTVTMTQSEWWRLGEVIRDIGNLLRPFCYLEQQDNAPAGNITNLTNALNGFIHEFMTQERIFLDED
jgi:hypothetical protein